MHMNSYYSYTLLGCVINMNLKIKIKKIQLLRTHGTDLINIFVDGATTFPIMKYDTVMKIECQQGYGEEYCVNELGIKPEILDVR